MLSASVLCYFVLCISLALTACKLRTKNQALSTKHNRTGDHFMRTFLLSLLLSCVPVVVQAQQPDYSKVEIKATKVAGNVYMLEGAGGNIGVSVGEDGILIVDDQFAPLADRIRAALKTLGQGKLKFILNTHWHGDHTGGNAAFSPEAPI